MLAPVSTSESTAEASRAIEPVTSQPASLTTHKEHRDDQGNPGGEILQRGRLGRVLGSWGMALIRKPG